MNFLPAIGFDPIDYIALATFAGAWVLYEYTVYHGPRSKQTLSGHMKAYRRVWIENMIRRDPKMLDSMVQNTLQQGVLFFASSSILLVGALVAGLSISQDAIDMLNAMPLISETSGTEWRLKILISIFIFVFAFFKFAWSYRLFSYFIILIGAAPDASRPENLPSDDAIAEHATRLGEIHSLAASHFTAGVNAYFQALAIISWFINPWLFLASTAWVFLVLYRRAFYSRTQRILEGSPLNPERER